MGKPRGAALLVPKLRDEVAALSQRVADMETANAALRQQLVEAERQRDAEHIVWQDFVDADKAATRLKCETISLKRKLEAAKSRNAALTEINADLRTEVEMLRPLAEVDAERANLFNLLRRAEGYLHGGAFTYEEALERGRFWREVRKVLGIELNKE